MADGPLPARRTRRADLLRRRRRRQPGPGAGVLAAAPRTPRPTCRPQIDYAVATSGARGAAGPGRRPGLHRRHQRLHRRLGQRPLLPRRVRPHRPHGRRSPTPAPSSRSSSPTWSRWPPSSARSSAPAAAARSTARSRCSPPSQKYGVDRGHQGLGVLPRAQRPRGRAHRPRRRELPVRRQARRRRRARPCPTPARSTPEPLVHDRTGSAATADRHRAPRRTAAATALSSAKRGMSNALVVSGKHTASGHPVAVFGPQTGYFAPQLLMLQEIQGPGISARGASFAGLSMYVELGRGQDYAWSATTSGQDIIDTYAVELCQDDYHYLYHGTCTAMEKLEQTNSWKPTTRRLHRRGLVPHAGLPHQVRPGGRTARRSAARRSPTPPCAPPTARGRLDHRLPDAQRPGLREERRRPSRARRSTSTTPSTGSTPTPAHTAYYNSGDNPVRAERRRRRASRSGRRPRTSGGTGTRPTNTAAYTAAVRAPQLHRPGLLRLLEQQAGQGLHRGLLRRRLRAPRRPPGRPGARSWSRRAGSPGPRWPRRWPTPHSPTCAAEDVLPELLKVVNSSPVTDSAAAAAVQQAAAWRDGRRQAHGDLARARTTYADADAIRILDAWWPLLVKAEFEPGLGTDLYTALHHQPPRRRVAVGRRTARPARTPEAPSSTAGGAMSTRTSGRCSASPCRAPLAQTVLRRRQPQRLPGRPDQHPEAGGRQDRRARSTPATTTARRATSGAPTRSSSARWAASSTTRSAGRTGRPTSRSWSSRRTGDGERGRS